MSPREAYYEFQKELTILESQVGVYLAEQAVDEENLPEWLPKDEYAAFGVSNGSDRYWTEMLRCAQSAAGMRAEEAGLDINKLLGRTVY